MSSLPYAQLTDLFNPNDFTALDSSLSLATADQRYVRIGSAGYLSSLSTIGNIDAASFSLSGASIDLSAISGVTPGIAAASKALIVDSSRDITNINALTATGTNALLRVNRTTNGQSFNSTNGTSTCVLYHFNNGDAYLGTTSSNNLVFQTKNTARMTIDSLGAISGISSLTGTSLIATNLTGTLQTVAQPNITSIGTLTALNVNGITALTPTNYGSSPNNIDGCIYRTISGRIFGFRELSGSTSWAWGWIGGGSYNDYLTLYNTGTYRMTLNGNFNASGYYLSGTALDFSNLSLINGITPGTAMDSKALIVDSSRNIVNINALTATTLTATTLTATTNLVVGTANINSTEMGYLDGAAPGNAIGGKAVIMNAGNDISGIDFINCDSIIMSGLLQFQGSSNSWNFRDNIFGTYMQIDCGTTSATNGCYLKLLTGNNASYVDWTFQNTDYFNLVNMGFYRVGTNTPTTGREWIRSDGGALGFSTRSGFTGVSANADIFIHNNIGVVSLGRSSLINSAHRLECNGALLISNTASTVNLTNTPTIGIYNSAQATGIKPYVSYGKDDSTSIADYVFSGYYSGSASSANNYTLWQSNGSNGGMTMNGFSNVKITCRNGGAYSSPTGAGFEVVGHETSISVPSGYSYTSTGQASIGGGAVSICAKFSNNVWATGIFYSTSDRRLKQDIESIPEADFKKILELRPVSYTWKRDQTSTLRGLIAQEVAEHLPELVYLAENKEDPLIDDDVQQIISYSSFVPYLIGLCKMQQKEISEALRSIDDLLDRVKRLELEPNVRKPLKRPNF